MVDLDVQRRGELQTLVATLGEGKVNASSITIGFTHKIKVKELTIKEAKTPVRVILERVDPE